MPESGSLVEEPVCLLLLSGSSEIPGAWGASSELLCGISEPWVTRGASFHVDDLFTFLERMLTLYLPPFKGWRVTAETVHA